MIGAVENALTGALAAASNAGRLGYAWRTLESYPEDFDAYLKEKGQLRCPAAWAVFLQLAEGADHADEQGWSGKASFALVVAAENVRNETATRHGGPDPLAEPGVYQLAIDATRVLSRNSLDGLLPAGAGLIEPVTVKSMRLVARTPETRRHKLALMAIEIECRLPFGPLPADSEPGDFTHLHLDWDVPAHGNVSAPLPAATPDAEDLIVLPS